MPKKPKRAPKKRGPKADMLVIDRNWKDAVSDAMKRGKPPAEEAKPPKKKRASKK
ncbi:MAG TPA: hypothetical protein VGQ44_02680 [Gemmatimonadaceae bacterium]|nr:hypothetical protein [Gemmatimonadaceae bacterium]